MEKRPRPDLEDVREALEERDKEIADSSPDQETDERRQRSEDEAGPA